MGLNKEGPNSWKFGNDLFTAMEHEGEERSWPQVVGTNFILHFSSYFFLIILLILNP